MLKFKNLLEGKNPTILHKEVFNLKSSFGSAEDEIVRYAINRWLPDNMDRYDKEGETVYIDMGYDYITYDGVRDEHDPTSVPGPRSINQAYIITFWQEAEV